MTKKTDREIDQIVDTLVGDHEVAETLKAKLHDTPLPAEKAERADPEQGEPDRADGADDLWDNLPI
ncbi:hypothetical protein [Celeribacter sp.]|uniref:hypothetical protein n=1 Tax=Celeribacter sp. TaxID=1890673 RepID=UPI003A8E4499